MTELPHEILSSFLAFHLGRRASLYGAFYQSLFEPITQAVSDELSIYAQMHPYCRLKVRRAYVKEGMDRSYVFIVMTDRGGPLNMLGTMSRYDLPMPNGPDELAEWINGRRWNFAENNLTTVMLPLLTKVADALQSYYQRRPYAIPQAGLIRWVEGVDNTCLVTEIDDRSVPLSIGENRGRYLIQ